MVPAFVYSLYLTLCKTDISLRWTLIAGPKGVRLGESWLYSYCLLFANDNLPSSETQGRLVEPEEKARRKITSTCYGPGNAGSWTGRKNALHYCAQSAWVLFVSSNMTAFVSPFLSRQSSAYNRQSNAPGSYVYKRQVKCLQLIATEKCREVCDWVISAWCWQAEHRYVPGMWSRGWVGAPKYSVPAIEMFRRCLA